MSLTATQINAIYEAVMQRGSTTPEQTAWVAADAVLGDATVISDFVNSAETQEFVWPIIQIYQLAFGIFPTAAQLAAWVAAEAGEPTVPGTLPAPGNLSLTAIASIFVGSQGFANLYNGGTLVNPNSAPTAAIMEALYINALTIIPTSAQLNAWLNSGLSIAQIFVIFSQNSTYVANLTSSIQYYLTSAANLAVGLPPPPLPTTNYVLTTGLDTISPTGSSLNGVTAPAATGNDAIFGTLFAAGGGTPTLQGFDTITPGGTNNKLTITDSSSDATNTHVDVLPLGLTLSNVQTVTVLTANNAGSIAGGVTFDASGVGGLTQLTVNSTGTFGDNIKAAATTSVTDTAAASGITINGGLIITASATGGSVSIGGTTAPAGTITVTDSAIGTNTVTVNGGTTISVAITGATAASASTAQITIGATTVPTGAVSVSAITGSANGSTIGAIAVTGGTTVTINELAGDTAATGTNVAMGNVAVTGTLATTSVTINQAAVAVGQTAIAAVAGVAPVAAVTAAPGVNGVTAVAGVTPIVAVAARTGVSADGTVNIADAVAPNSTTATAGGVSGGTISTVSLNNFGAANISSPALSNLTLSGTGAAVNLYEGGTLSATNTTLTLNVNNLSGVAITDNSNQFTTLDVATGATNSTLASFTDTSLKNLNLSGSSLLTVTAATSATSITVTGAAGYKGSINDTTTTFNGAGSTGADTITIAADATKAITGGSGSGNEIIANAAGGTFTAANTGANVTGFQTLGITSTTTGTTNASVFGLAINKIDVTASITTASTLTNVNTDAAINFSAGAATSTAALVVNYVDVTGASDAVTVTLAGESTSSSTTGAITNAAQSISSLTLEDANSNGIGTLSFVDNNIGFNYAGDNIATLIDPNVTTLNFSGVGGLTIGATAFTNAAPTMTVDNTGTNVAGLVLSMTDNTLGSLTFNGSGMTTVSLADSVAGSLVVTNSGSGAVNLIDATLVAGHVTLAGAITAALADTNTAGVTVSGSTDNNHVILILTGAASGNTDTISLGNANNAVLDTSSAGTVNITVGTGSNLIDLHTGSAASYSASIALGSHTSTGPDEILVGTVAAAAVAPNTVITGAVAGDMIKFVDNGTTELTLNASQLSTAASEASLAAAVGYVDGQITTAHTAAAFMFGGNTYIIESAAAGNGTLTANDALVELVGTHTLSATVTANIFTLAS